MDVEDLVKSPDKVNELLEVLDEIARDVSSYEYGLPMFDDGAKARLREAVYQWACGALTPQPTLETSAAPTTSPDEVGKAAYAKYVDDSGIHSNRFPSWSELTQPERDKWTRSALNR